MWPCSPFYGWLLWQARPKSPHLPAITLPDCHRRQPPMAGDFRLGARYLHAISAVPSTPPQLTPTITCHNNLPQAPLQQSPAPKHLISANPKFTCHTMRPYKHFYGRLLWQVRSKSPHLPALSLPDCYRRQPPMAGDFLLTASHSSPEQSAPRIFIL